MDNNNSIFGCFVKTTASSSLNSEEQNLVFEKGKLFRTYIFGEKGINKYFKNISNINYGNDLELILFQFYVYPLQDLKPIEYKKREKSISIPIVINDDNFFDLSEEMYLNFLKETILKKIELVFQVVKDKQLDTKVEKLKNDLLEAFEEL